MLSPVMGARRSMIEIVYEMLSACNDGAVNKTAIMYRCSLSYDQLRRYLARLCDQGLIRLGHGGHYGITPRGRETLGKASAVIEVLTPVDDIQAARRMAAVGVAAFAETAASAD